MWEPETASHILWMTSLRIVQICIEYFYILDMSFRFLKQDSICIYAVRRNYTIVWRTGATGSNKREGIVAKRTKNLDYLNGKYVYVYRGGWNSPSIFCYFIHSVLLIVGYLYRCCTVAHYNNNCEVYMTISKHFNHFTVSPMFIVRLIYTNRFEGGGLLLAMLQYEMVSLKYCKCSQMTSLRQLCYLTTRQ